MSEKPEGTTSDLGNRPQAIEQRLTGAELQGEALAQAATLEVRIAELEQRLTTAELQCEALIKLVDAVIDSHPEPLVLLGMVSAQIANLPSSGSAPSAEKRRSQLVSALSQAYNRILRAASNLEANRIAQERAAVSAAEAIEAWRRIREERDEKLLETDPSGPRFR